MARKAGLGRGLNALLDNNDYNDPDDQKNIEIETLKGKSQNPEKNLAIKNKAQDIIQLPVDKLIPNPGQPRKNFNETELKEMADSIKIYGIIQPVIAANAGDGTYIIIAGERRTRAARLAGLTAVPVIVREYTDQKRLEISLIENIQRSALNPIEEAAAYKNLMDYSRLTQDELAIRMGKNRSTVANALRLLKLPVEMQKSIEEGSVSSGHARTILSVNDSGSKEKLYREILSNGLSVREAEKRAAALNEKKGKDKNSDTKDKAKSGVKKRLPEIEDMEEKFRNKFGTKVYIDGDLTKGKIYIEYYTKDDLDRFYEIIT
ncbi:MAG: ParB/RepB/Spo0J family partition protein [Treponema sp.]|nr:ParB/RepB/Spo0J family partition protein [Treponema sp.]